MDTQQSSQSIALKDQDSKLLDQQPITLYPYRFVSLVVYCLLAMITSFAPQTFVAVSVEISELYNQSSTVLTITGLAYTLAHSFVVFPANYILDQKGLRAGIVIGNIFLILGHAVRILINQGFWLYILGTYITSLGFIFILNGATKFSNVWFGVKETSMVNSIILFLVFASEPLGVFIPVLFIDKESTKQDVFHVVLYISIVIIAICALGILIIRNKPPTPAKQNHSSKRTKEKFLESIKSLVRDRNYIMLFLAVTVCWGCVSAFFVTLPWQLKPFGYTSDDVGIIVLSANGLGLVGCVLVGIYIQKTKKYKTVLLTLVCGATLSLSVLWVVLQTTKTKILFFINASFVGLFLFPFFTTIIDLSNEISFPIGQATSSGFLLCGGQIFGFVLGLVMSVIFDGQSFTRTRIGTGVYVLMFVLGILFITLFKQDLKKMKYEEGKGSFIVPHEQQKDK